MKPNRKLSEEMKKRLESIIAKAHKFYDKKRQANRQSTKGGAMENLTTIYFSKHFTSGILKGLTVHCEVPRISMEKATWYSVGRKGKDYCGGRWVIVDASFQKYAR